MNFYFILFALFDKAIAVSVHMYTFSKSSLCESDF